MTQQNLILASQSQARRRLLSCLGLSFQVMAADLDETPLKDESAEQLVSRLAQAKAQAIAKQQTTAIIIGADEVGTVDGTILGKPQNIDDARMQLRLQSGREVTFVTGLCVLNSSTQTVQQTCVHYYVTYKHLDEAQIEQYLSEVVPLHCAASLMIEKQGITLCERLRGDDPSSLLGLPLIALVGFLQSTGLLAGGTSAVCSVQR